MMVVDESDTQVNTNLRVLKSDLDRFDRIAIARRMSRAALFRESILKTIEEHELFWERPLEPIEEHEKQQE